MAYILLCAPSIRKSREQFVRRQLGVSLSLGEQTVNWSLKDAEIPILGDSRIGEAPWGGSTEVRQQFLDKF